MNGRLTPSEAQACLEILYRALLQLRIDPGNRERTYEIADALHNLPHLLGDDPHGYFKTWTLDGFRELFLLPLIEKYPEFAGWDEELQRAASQASSA